MSNGPSPPPPSPWPVQCGCSVAQPMDNQPGCPSCGVAPPGGTPLLSTVGLRSFGTPSWSVNLFSLNLIVRDTPAFYSPGLGPMVAWDLTFNSHDPNAGTSPFNYLFGNNIWSPYQVYVVDYGSQAHVIMADGREDWYYPVNTYVNPVAYNPASGTGIYNVLTKDTTHNVFTLTLADRSETWTFAQAFTYNGTNYYALTKIADRIGNAVTLAYSSGTVPKLTSLTDANGNTSQVVYNPYGQAGQINDPFGGNAQFSYTSINGAYRLSAITDQAGYTSTLGYDGSGRLTSLTTPLTAPNPTWQFAYPSGSDRVSSITDPYNNVRSYTTTATATTRTDPLGRKTTFDFSTNSFGGPGVITDAMNNQTQCQFDANRNVTRFIDARGYFTDYTYDGQGNVLTEKRYRNLYPDTSQYIQRSWTYDGSNNVLTATDPAGTESWTYNANNQVLTWTDKLNHTTTNSYNSQNLLATVTDRNGIVAVTNSYDTSGRLISTADALGNTVKSQWDNRGRRTQVTDHVNNSTSFTYDLLDRVTVTTFADQTTIQNTYNCCALTQVTDQNQGVTKLSYDNLTRLVQVTDQTNAVVKLAYDAVNNLLSLTDPNSHTWQWQYDPLNRRNKQIDPPGNQMTWTYDAVGNVITRVDGNGASTSYNYDAFDRLALTTYPDTSTVAMTYDDVGNRLTVVDALGTWSWTYDALGRVTRVLTPMASTTTQSAYDNEGHRIQLTDPDGNTIAIGYDNAYRIASMRFPLGGQTLTASYQRDPRGLPIQRTLPNGVVSTYGFDSMWRRTSIQHKRSDQTLLFSFGYQYDKAGNPTQETSQRWDTGLGTTVPFQVNYGYDARFQLTSEKYFKNNNFILEQDYTYDPAGNRTRLVHTDPTTQDSPVTTTATYGSDNQITQTVRTAPLDPTQTTNYSEDKNGNLTQAANNVIGTTGYAYDFENRLTRVNLPAGTNVQFKYDADGLRVQKTGTGGAVTNYVLDGLQALIEKDGTGTTQVRYVPGLARIVSGSIGYYLEDRLGSVVGLADASQNVTDTLRYDAWGNLLQQQGTTQAAYQWVGTAGYYLNLDAGLCLLGLRYFSPSMGRFLTRDPIGFSGGVNQYGYVGNSPSGYRDPYGLQPVAPAAVAAGPAVAANPAVAAGCAAFAFGFAVGYCIGEPLFEWCYRSKPLPGPKPITKPTTPPPPPVDIDTEAEFCKMFECVSNFKKGERGECDSGSCPQPRCGCIPIYKQTSKGLKLLRCLCFPY